MIIRNYKIFINEANVWQMSSNNYVEFVGNLKGIPDIKGKVAQITKATRERVNGKLMRRYELKIQDGKTVTDRTGETPVETDTINITSGQLRNLVYIPAQDYLRRKEGHTLHFNGSEKFKFLLKDIKFNIPYNLYDASYFDIVSDDVISFLPANRYELCIKNNENFYESKYRQTTKVGRVFRKLNDKLTDQQIEKFVVDFRGSYDFLNRDKSKNLFVVTGDRISYWYDEARYRPGNGTLNRSCMRGSGVQYRLKNFYDKFPDKIALCILIDDDNKLLARAIIWKLDSPKDVIFMDRIYYVEDKHGKILEMYAAQNDMKTKISNYSGDKKLTIKFHNFECNYNIPWNSTDNIPLPYMDTMNIWDNIKKELSNK